VSAVRDVFRTAYIASVQGPIARVLELVDRPGVARLEAAA
jgi:hypothetical protein